MVAVSLDFVEKNPKNVNVIKQNLKQLSLKNLDHKIHQANVFEFLKVNQNRYDFIFADPPYEEKNVLISQKQQLLECLKTKPNLLLEGAYVIIEQAAKEEIIELESWNLVKSKVYGSSSIHFYQLSSL